jgi:hypothetical protein
MPISVRSGHEIAVICVNLSFNLVLVRFGCAQLSFMRLETRFGVTSPLVAMLCQIAIPAFQACSSRRTAPLRLLCFSRLCHACRVPGPACSGIPALIQPKRLGTSRLLNCRLHPAQWRQILGLAIRLERFLTD